MKLYIDNVRCYKQPEKNIDCEITELQDPVVPITVLSDTPTPVPGPATIIILATALIFMRIFK